MSTKINNGLFMGDIDAAQDSEFLSLNGIEFIVNCVPREVPNVFESEGIRYFACDMAEQPEGILFDLRNADFVDLIDFIDHAVQSSLSLLVHSLDGMSRSPCVMMAYLMSKYHWSLDKAYEYVKMKRPDIAPHNAYLDQLAMLDAQLQKKHRAPEKKRNEWDPAHTDPKTDELVLVNTFLNVTNGIALPHDSAPRKLKKKRLVWIDLCPHIRKGNPHYDFTKLERPPSASYSSLIAGNGWVDTEAAPMSQRPSTSPAASRVAMESRAVHDVDLSLSEDEEHERLTDPKEDDSWDLSLSDPGMSHDTDFDKPLSSWVSARQVPPPKSVQQPDKRVVHDSMPLFDKQQQHEPEQPRQVFQPPPMQHRSSFPSHHIKLSKAAPAAPASYQLHDDLSQNQHSPTEKPDADAFKSSANRANNNHPRYLQHTKSSRNAKTMKASQGRYAMPVVVESSVASVGSGVASTAVPMACRGMPPKRMSKSSCGVEGPADTSRSDSTSSTRLPTTATSGSKQGMRTSGPLPASSANNSAAVRPKTAPPSAGVANYRLTTSKPTSTTPPMPSGIKKKPTMTTAPPAKQPRPPAPKGSTNHATDLFKKVPPPDTKAPPHMPATNLMPRRASSAKWR
ncbi:hypothetical protein H310_09228 [Aphanomyces invadans]|uniref:Tyrosine-protein phosphatase domain-containing protein n=1 Tax=Aphanomyces invadans TaxID=157072 RepID=A0A024TVD1_9STRA|nr:hypothetical protein H310_09228 [Aphanomyces invadans]ETV97909.1 hypothetical protein H310_09228 [Aphanomyces invadans]|eukprot:XP_008873470.1 hypothetical protein H310_09228 [Aphanomyces invadans]